MSVIMPAKKKLTQDRKNNILSLMIDDSKITIPQLSEKLNVSTRTKNPYIYL